MLKEMQFISLLGEKKTCEKKNYVKLHSLRPVQLPGLAKVKRTHGVSVFQPIFPVTLALKHCTLSLLTEHTDLLMKFNLFSSTSSSSTCTLQPPPPPSPNSELLFI